MRVGVVGAGFSGLAAAEGLLSAGVAVTVFEARDRVGGRVWSQALSNGAVIERGAEFVLEDYEVMREMLADVGLALDPTGMSYGNREPRGVDTDRSEVRAAFHTLAATARAREDLRSVGDVLDVVDLPAPVRAAVVARLSISAAHEALDLSASTLLHSGSTTSDQESHRVSGGNDRLARTIAASLGDRVDLDTPVASVRWREGSATIAGQGFKEDFDAVVISVPASVMSALRFDPPLPDQVGAQLDGIDYGHAAKLFAPLTGTAATSSVMSVPDHYWCWTALGVDGHVQPVVSCFAGSGSALKRLAVTAGPEVWIERLRSLRPDLELDPGGAVLSTWDDDPWVGAAYTAERAGRPRTDALSVPVGPLYFAGEHTAGEWAGTMEGALRSGRRAAEQILQRTP